jgi:MFS family permease
VKPLELLRTNRNLRHLFIAQIVSFAGDWFAFVALSGRIQDLTHSDFLVSLVYVLETLPVFFMMPIAGSVVDRFDRRKIIIVVSAVQTVGALGMLLVRSKATVPIGFVCVALVAALASFVAPAIQAAVPNLTRSPEELNTAAAIFGSTWGVMLAVGAAAGGFVADRFGRDTAFIANAGSFVAAGVFVALITMPMQEARHAQRARVRPLADMAEAAHMARRDHVMLALLASKMTAAIGSGIVGLLVVFAKDELHGGDASRGLLLAARGVGAGIGPIVAARFVKRDLSRMLTVCGMAGLVFGAGYLSLSVSHTLLLGLLFVGIAHFAGGAQWTMSTYGLQVRAPDEIRGRILAGDFAIVTLVLSVSGLAAGIIADSTDNRRATMVGFSLVAAAAALVNLTLTRRLRARLREEARASAQSAAATS